MALVQVPAETPTGFALVNPLHVVALASPDHRPDLTLIVLMLGARAGKDASRPNEVFCKAPVDVLLKAFGPFVRVRRQQPQGNPWTDYHLRLASIASAYELRDGRAYVYMIDGYEYLIEDGSVLRGAGIEITVLE